MTKKMKEALAVLGPDYTTIFFDGEKRIYEELPGDTFECTHCKGCKLRKV